jgi:hypothetical protein
MKGVAFPSLCHFSYERSLLSRELGELQANRADGIGYAFGCADIYHVSDIFFWLELRLAMG